MRITPLTPPLPPRAHRLRLSRPHPVRSIREFWQELFHPTIHHPSTEKTEIESLRVAVLVAMPSQERRWRDKAAANRSSTASSSACSDDGVGGEVALGIAEMSWRWSESVLDEGSSSSKEA